MSPRLAGPLVKVARAKMHIDALEAELQSFFATKPYVIGTKRDPDTRQLIYYMVNVGETSDSVAAIAGDALQCLRSALDHLAYQLVLAGTGQAGPFFHVYFPIANSFAKYEAKKSGRLKGASDAAIAAIDAVKPYKGGNDSLWLLHTLNNIDKHRLLITVGSAARSVDLGAYMHRMMQTTAASSPLWEGKNFPVLHAFFRPADRMCSLKPGDELFIDGPDAQPNVEMQFRFDVAFSEPGIPDDPVVETLQKMAVEVENLLLTFNPLL